MSNFNIKFRAANLFADIVSQGISISINSDSNGDDVMPFVLRELAKQDSMKIFCAAAKLMPNASVEMFNKQSETLLDAIIIGLAGIITNDIFQFTSTENFAKEYKLTEGKFPVVKSSGKKTESNAVKLNLTMEQIISIMDDDPCGGACKL